MVENATFANWAPDGERLAIVRKGNRCEFPAGQTFADRCFWVRVSPQSDHLAFVGGGNVLQVQRFDGTPVATTEMPYIFGVAWSPDGREVWFTGSERGSALDRALYALSLDGTRRLVARIPGAMTVYDVAPDGTGALIATGAGWYGINAASVDRGGEQSLDLLGRADIVGFSADGKWLLIDETQDVGTGAYLRSTDGAQTLRLGADRALGLSPDGASAVVQARGESTFPAVPYGFAAPIQPRGEPTRLKLMPIGAGAPREIALDPGLEVSPSEVARWSADGRRLFLALRPVRTDDRSARIYVRDGEGPWQAITPAGVAGPFAVSPDGQTVAARDETGLVALFPVAGGAPKRLDGERGTPVHWSADRRQLFLVGPERLPLRVHRRDLVSGRVELWRTVAPADPTGVMFVGRVLLSADAGTYVYQYSRGLNELFLAQGLR